MKAKGLISPVEMASVFQHRGPSEVIRVKGEKPILKYLGDVSLGPEIPGGIFFVPWNFADDDGGDDDDGDDDDDDDDDDGDGCEDHDDCDDEKEDDIRFSVLGSNRSVESLWRCQVTSS